MNRKLLFAFTVLVFVSACAKQSSDQPSIAANPDSILSAPASALPDTARATVDSNGRIVDLSQSPPADRKALLNRFPPKRLVDLYDAYRPLRRSGTPRSTIDSFLRANKITEPELRAILTQGDELGWSGER